MEFVMIKEEGIQRDVNKKKIVSERRSEGITEFNLRRRTGKGLIGILLFCIDLVWHCIDRLFLITIHEEHWR
jgi:hypothetical protein